ncbi:hypothetical protein PAESOLCIP111_05237 [Paenibacillus solanacearum]|uniref:Nucleotidyltransferase domain-containing protein n=1 Tax=Paenibacillus solanacearum TaxID=2048548 RepID=A0A916K8Q7_9BACL|nr:nucleotidyltransferase domain-containing protein [Paenibacillus solanacearum]CAG7646774.1 hypothetical protein PAESOLCIP111_05237 [Paenibacillus solanacearum]
MSGIPQHVIAALQAIEQEEHVRILYACEAGSRAWGLHSEESDHDVRFIYIRPTAWYLSIFDQSDVIQRPAGSSLDLSGWDLRKALRLLRKSNPSLLEWLQSPIVYAQRESVASQLRNCSAAVFSPRSCACHYLNMAKRNIRLLEKDRQRIKNYVYVLRPILACQWIERYRTMPPLAFPDLMKRLVLEGSELWAAMLQLSERKKSGGDLADGERWMTPIHTFLERQLACYDQAAVKMAERQEHSEEQGDDDRLNTLFRSALNDVWASDV